MKVLVLAPHPDDEAIGCGGSIIKHASNGDEVAVLYLTNGGNLKLERNEISVHKKNRIRESELCCEILNVNTRYYMDANEQNIIVDDISVNYVSNIISEFNPTLVYCPHQNEWDKDHKITYDILQVVMNKQTEKKEIDIFYYEVWTPIQYFNVATDITDVFQNKMDSLNQYKSQIAIKRYDLCVKSLNFYRAIMHDCGKRYAEVFQRGQKY